MPEYFLYDPDTERLDGFRLIGSSYAALQPNDHGWLWSAELGLWLGTWIGVHNGLHATWLRMFTSDGVLVPTHGEAEQQEREREQQAPIKKNSADQAEQELARLRALLQQQQPPKTNGDNA